MKPKRPLPVLKTKMSSPPLLRSICVMLGLLCGVAVTVPASARAAAPMLQSGDSALRTITGQVVNKSNAPLTGAVVYLKDTKTLAVKSFIADEQGKFHFGQLAQTTDYEIYAESNGKHSNTKKISSFDSHNTFNFTLTINADK